VFTFVILFFCHIFLPARSRDKPEQQRLPVPQSGNKATAAPLSICLPEYEYGQDLSGGRDLSNLLLAGLWLLTFGQVEIQIRMTVEVEMQAEIQIQIEIQRGMGRV